MKIFTTSDDLFTHLTKLAEKYAGGTIDIATYGMYVGITNGIDYSLSYPSAARTFLNTIVANETSHRILIGVPYFMECLKGCQNCASNYNRTLDRFEQTRSQLGLNIRYTDNLHLKYYRISTNYFAGGINLSTSKSVDFAMRVEGRIQTLKLGALFKRLWSQGTESIEPYCRKES